MHTFRIIIANLLHTRARADDGVDTAADGASDSDVDGDRDNAADVGGGADDCDRNDDAANDINAVFVDDNNATDDMDGDTENNEGNVVAGKDVNAVVVIVCVVVDDDGDDETGGKVVEVGPESEPDVWSERRRRCRRERRRRQLG